MANDRHTSYSAEALPKLMTFRLSRLQARANAQAARILMKHAGISLSEWRIFVIIETNGKIAPAEIVRLTQFDKGLVSRTIKKLHENGMVRIENSESDHRSHLIDFTPQGFALFERARPIMRRRQKLFRDALEPEELEVLFRAFDKLDLALDDMEDKL
ncbi:MAG: MarR family transcriptional regulator [Rhizobiaceae bacterium]